MATGERRNGEFCWLNILTPDPASAQRFFGELLGWEYVEIPGMGHRVQVGGHDIGGMWDHAGADIPPGTPPGIGLMVRVANADEIAARVTELGGSSKPAFDIMEQGRMAECYDVNGANLDVWQGKLSPGMTADATVHGAPSWFEALTTDVPKAKEFYTRLFGWEAKKAEIDGWDYTTFYLGDTPVAGMLAITPDMGPIPPHWAVYLTVNDVDATVAKAESLGGAVQVPAMDVPTVGRFAGLVSPQGVYFCVIKYLEQ